MFWRKISLLPVKNYRRCRLYRLFIISGVVVTGDKLIAGVMEKMKIFLDFTKEKTCRPKALPDQSLDCMFIGIGILALFACIQNIQWCLVGGRGLRPVIGKFGNIGKFCN